MEKLNLYRIKKALAILLVAFFVVSAAAASVSAARPSHDYGYRTNVYSPVEINLNNAINTGVANAISVNTIVSFDNYGNIFLNSYTSANTDSIIGQHIGR